MSKITQAILKVNNPSFSYHPSRQSRIPGLAQVPGTWFLLRLLITACSLLAVTCGFLVISAPGSFADELDEMAQRGKSDPIVVLSIAPSKAEPGMTVTLFGSGFTESTRAFIGDKEARTAAEGSRQISFEIPDLTPGLYALYLKREDGKRSRVYKFNVTPRTPVIDSLEPDRIIGCSSGTERQVRIIGSSFQKNAQVLFDGAVIGSTFASPESLSVAIPQVAGGMHTLQVKSPEGAASSVMALFIDSTPVITGVSQGEQNVNYYNLIIEGQNFMRNSTLLVDGKSMSLSAANPFDREKVRYVDCTRIIYERHPYDTEIKNFAVQIINANGEESPSFQVSAP